MSDSSIPNQSSLIRSIQRGGSERTHAITEIYNSLDLSEVIRKSITKTSYNQMDHLDLLHDAFYVFLKKVKEGKFALDTPIKPFLMSTAKLIWLNKQTKAPREFTTDTIYDINVTESVEQVHIHRELSEHMKKVFGRLTSGCQQILSLWIQEYSYKEIANQLGLKDQTYVRKRKFSCYQGLLELIRETPELKDYQNG